MAHRKNTRSLPVINYDEWAKALQTVSVSKERPKGFVTKRELANANGWSEGKARDVILKLFSAGKLDVGRVEVLRMDGQNTTVPAYKLKVTK